MEILKVDDRLTTSQIKCVRKCGQMHYIKYRLGIRPAEAAAFFRLGGVFHQGVDLKGKGADAMAATGLALCQYDNALSDCHDAELYAKLEIEREVCGRLLTGYFWRWSEMDPEIEVVASELPFEIKIINPETGGAMRKFTLCGKIDKIIKYRGKLYIMEHKTTGEDLSIESTYWMRLRLDLQISIYFMAARELGYDVEGIYYDVIKKPSMAKPIQLTQGRTELLLRTGEYLAKFDGDENESSIGYYTMRFVDNDTRAIVSSEHNPLGYEVPVTPGKKEGTFSIPETVEMYGDRISKDMERRPDFYFARKPVTRLESDIEETRLAVYQWAQIIAENDKRGRHPRNDDACVWLGRCPFLNLCTTGYDFTTRGVPEGFEQVDNVHQELAGE